MKRQLLISLFSFILISVTSMATEINLSYSATSSSILEFAKPLPASFTVNQLFDRMERKSESIEAIESEVELCDDISTSTVTLRIKSPDKFSIIFSDGSSSVFFNGNNLWIYIKNLNECFYYESESSPFIDKWGIIMAVFNPKKIFVNMTRSTLSAFFSIEAVKREKMKDGDYHYNLKLTPKLSIFVQIFELGCYEAIFSEKIYLPVKVIEYGSDNKIKSVLSVKSYKINEKIEDKKFEYENTTKADMIPISVVIMQKIEDYKDSIIKKVDKAKEAVKNSFLNWGL